MFSRAIFFAIFLFILLVIVGLVYEIPRYLHVRSEDFILESHLPVTPNLTVPRIFHQTAPDGLIPPRLLPVRQACLDLHPDFEYKLWSDEQGRDLIREHLPDLLSTYDSYWYGIQRADVIRLVVMYLYGGIYLDTDVGCARSLEPLLTTNITFPQAKTGISQEVIISTSRHAFLADLLRDLPKFNQFWLSRFVTVFLSTGPYFVSFHYARWKGGDQIKILPYDLTGKTRIRGDPIGSNVFFTHHSGRSWLGWDMIFIRSIDQYGMRILYGLPFVLLVIYLAKCKRFQQAGREQSLALPRYSGRWEAVKA